MPQQKNTTSELARITPDEGAALVEVFGEHIKKEDVAYIHTIFLQCFLPLKHSKKNLRRWQVNNGAASLLITAGEGIDPHHIGKTIQYDVPAGSMGNAIIAYVLDYIRTKKTPVIDMGENLTAALAEKFQIPKGGKNGKALERELHNFANCNILFMGWNESGAIQEGGRVGSRVHFWLEKDERQRTLWQQELTVSTDLFNAIMNSRHIAPLYLPAYMRLRRSPLAQNIFAWWSYRLRSPFPRGFVDIKAKTLHSVFGQDTVRLTQFWPDFMKAAALAKKEYKAARFEYYGEKYKPETWGLRLFSSGARIPAKAPALPPPEPRQKADKAQAGKPTRQRIPLTTAQVESLQDEFAGLDIEGLFKNEFWPWIKDQTTDPNKNVFVRFRGWLKKRRL